MRLKHDARDEFSYEKKHGCHLETVASVVGIASGISGLFGGGGGGGGGSAPSPQNADPFQPYRGGFASQLQQFMTNPNAITSDPSYQFRYNQGLEALQRGMTSQGMMGSGNLLASLENYGQNSASQEFQAQYSRLAQLSGADQSPAAGYQAQLAGQQQRYNQGQAGWSAVAQGLGSLNSIFGDKQQSGGKLGGVVDLLSNTYMNSGA